MSSRASAGEAPPPSPTRLLLVRHAVTEQTGPVLTGRNPGVSLSEHGVAQAEATADRLAAVPVAAVYSSPIERTAQTAAAIASRHGIDVRTDDGVLEADYGDWTGGKLADLAKTPEWKVVQGAPSRARFPNGEGLWEMQTRVVTALERIVAAHPHETVVVVSHADPIKSAVAHFCGLHLDLFQRIHVSPASVTAVQFHDGGVVVLTLNETGGLDELVPDPSPEGDGG